MPSLKKNKLSKSTGKNKWCGPVAVSMLTGKSSDEVAEVMASEREDPTKAIKGTFITDMEVALSHFGYSLREIEIPKRKGSYLSFINWVQTIRNKHLKYLLKAPKHWMVYADHRAGDTAGKTPVWIHEFKRRSKKILRCWEVVPDNQEHIAALASRYNLLDSDLEKLSEFIEPDRLEETILLAKQIDWSRND